MDSGKSLTESSSRNIGTYSWFLLLFVLVSFAALAYPIYVIRPFRHQGPRELAAALEVIQIRPSIELVCAVCRAGRAGVVLAVAAPAFRGGGWPPPALSSFAPLQS